LTRLFSAVDLEVETWAEADKISRLSTSRSLLFGIKQCRNQSPQILSNQSSQFSSARAQLRVPCLKFSWKLAESCIDDAWSVAMLQWPGPRFIWPAFFCLLFLLFFRRCSFPCSAPIIFRLLLHDHKVGPDCLAVSSAPSSKAVLGRQQTGCMLLHSLLRQTASLQLEQVLVGFQPIFRAGGYQDSGHAPAATAVTRTNRPFQLSTP
jgi:hypothetical protein